MDLSSRPVRRVEASEGGAHAKAWWARIPAIRSVLHNGLDLLPGVTFLVGENGSGKSTLVEGIAAAYGINPEGGSRHARHSTRATESPLGKALKLIRSPGGHRHAYFLRAETAHGLYTYLEALPGSPDHDLHERSHGEGFLALLDRKFDGAGFYLMDEPESALSFTSTLSLLARLSDLRSAGAQVVVATHSPLLVALPGAHIAVLDASGLQYVDDWRELELVGHWRMFLADPDRYLRHVLWSASGATFGEEFS